MRSLSFYLSVCFAVLSAFIFPACSDTVGPENLEPTITGVRVSDITRNEATLSVEVRLQGTGQLSFLHFKYGDSHESMIRTDDIENPSGTLDVRVSGLKAGTTYLLYAEGGSSTALLKTDTITFTTLPNQAPEISRLEILESGPTAVIISFCIDSDGGETMTDAGCEVKETATGVLSRRHLDSGSIREGRVSMLVDRLSPLSEFSFTAFASNSVGETQGETILFSTENAVRLTTAGHLQNLVDPAGFNSESLTISGKMNGDDFRFLRKLLKAEGAIDSDYIESSLSSVNLADVEIVEGGGSYDGARFTSDDVVSTGLFSGCRSLTALSMPMRAKKLEYNSLQDCSGLTAIVIPAGISAILPSSGCTSLRSIDVSEANVNYRSIDGVLFNADSSEIVWFPMGKRGEYSLPPTVTSIKENAFKDTGITSLVIPESVTDIERGAFAGSSLETISMPGKLTNVREGTFQGCYALSMVILGEETRFIGDYIFDGCPLRDLYVKATIPPYVSAAAFTNNVSLFESCVLHIPAGSKAVYRNHASWGKFRTITED